MDPQQRATAEGILFTDMYQLTMAQVYFRMGLHEKQVQFDHFFREYPEYGSHKAGFCINAGLEWLVDWMRESRFRTQDIDYLRSLEAYGHCFDDAVQIMESLKNYPLFYHIDQEYNLPDGFLLTRDEKYYDDK